MEDFPKGHTQVQDPQTSDRSSDPTGSNHALQAVETCLTRGIQKEIVVSPITQSQEPLRNPGQQRQHNADLEAKDNIEDNAQLG